MKSNLINLSRKLRQKKWGIGFIEAPIGKVLDSDYTPHIRWVKDTIKDRWFADPFILESTSSRIILLAEEFCYKVKRGRIAKLTIDREYMKIIDYKIVLDTDTHLSFPHIIRKENKTFVIPENYMLGNQWKYEYDYQADKLTPLHIIAKGTYTDAAFIDIDGRTFMLSTAEPNPNGNILTLYEVKDKFHKLEEIRKFQLEDNTARNGGAIFEFDGKYYRAAQICNNAYGEGIELQQMIVKNGQIEAFNPVRRIYPQGLRLSLGLHTFNISPTDQNLIVVDGHGYRHRHLALLIDTTASIKRYLYKKIFNNRQS